MCIINGDKVTGNRIPEKLFASIFRECKTSHLINQVTQFYHKLGDCQVGKNV